MIYLHSDGMHKIIFIHWESLYDIYILDGNELVTYVICGDE